MADEVQVIAKDSTIAESIIDSVFDAPGELPAETAAPDTPAEESVEKAEESTTPNAPEAALSDAADFSFTEPAAPTTPAKAEAEPQKPLNVKEVIAAFKRDELLEALGLDKFDIEFTTYRKNGGDPYKYLAAKTTDWTKVSDVDIMKAELKAEYPMFSQDKLDKLYSEKIYKKYGLTEDASEDESEYGKILLEADAYKARQKRIEEDSKLVIPDTIQAAQEEKVPDLRPMYMENPSIKQIIESKKVVADGGADGYKFNFKVSNPQVLVDFWVDPQASGKYLFNEKGEPDVDKQMFMSLVGIDHKQVIKQLIDYGRNYERSERLKTSQGGGQKQSVIPASTNAPDWSNAKDGRVGSHI